MLLAGLDVRGRRIVVVGAGRVAARRVRRFLGEGASVVVVAPTATQDLQGLAGHGDIAWLARAVEPADLDGAWLVVAATDDAAVNGLVAGWAADRRVFCIDTSDGDRGTARMAAASTHGGLAVGVVSTEGADPARARAVRDAVAAHIDAGGVDLRRRRPGPGRVVLVGSGPGDPGLITVRGRQALSEADVVVTDRLGATQALIALPDDVDIVNVGKSPGNHPVPQDEINRLLVAHASAGRTVVRLKGGDPFVFGRGAEEVQACVDAGIAVEVVPGVTSALAVPGCAGISVTHRGVATSVLITSGHAGADPAAIAAITAGATVVLLMGVTALSDIVSAALAAGADPATPVAIIERGSLPDQRLTRGTFADIVRSARETGVKPPAVIVIGEVAAP
jgi:uroporphyrin-III C-methyltransferase/precorrin-2 dehydrogenase/sirohydrochlorin ferrochelatase